MPDHPESPDAADSEDLFSSPLPSLPPTEYGGPSPPLSPSLLEIELPEMEVESHLPPPVIHSSDVEVALFEQKVPKLRTLLGKYVARSLPTTFLSGGSLTCYSHWLRHVDEDLSLAHPTTFGLSGMEGDALKAFMKKSKEDLLDSVCVHLKDEYLTEYIVAVADGQLSTLEARLCPEDFLRVLKTIRDYPEHSGLTAHYYSRMMVVAYKSFASQPSGRPWALCELGMGSTLEMAYNVGEGCCMTTAAYYMQQNRSVVPPVAIDSQPKFSTAVFPLMLAMTPVRLKRAYYGGRPGVDAEEKKAIWQACQLMAGEPSESLEDAKNRLYWSRWLMQRGRLAEALGQLLSVEGPLGLPDSVEEGSVRVDFFSLLIDLSSQMFLSTELQCRVINWAFRDTRSRAGNNILLLEQRQYALIPSVVKALVTWGMFDCSRAMFNLRGDPTSTSFHRAQGLLGVLQGLGENIENQLMYICTYRKYHHMCFMVGKSSTFHQRYVGPGVPAEGPERERFYAEVSRRPCCKMSGCRPRIRNLEIQLRRYAWLVDQLALTRVPSWTRNMYAGLHALYRSLVIRAQGEDRRMWTLLALAQSHFEMARDEMGDASLVEYWTCDALYYAIRQLILDPLAEFSPVEFLACNGVSEVNKGTVNYPMAKLMFTGTVLACCIQGVNASCLNEWFNSTWDYYLNSSRARSYRATLLEKAQAVIVDQYMFHEWTPDEPQHRTSYLSTSLCHVEREKLAKINALLFPTTNEVGGHVLPLSLSSADGAMIPPLKSFASLHEYRHNLLDSGRPLQLRVADADVGELTLEQFAASDERAIGEWLYFAVLQQYDAQNE